MPATEKKSFLTWCCPCIPAVAKPKSAYYTEVLGRVKSSQGSGDNIDKSLLLLNYDASRPIDEKYTMGKKVGSGAFGSVFKAIHKTSREDRAVKVIPKSEVTDERELVLTEIEAILRLDHPNIVKYYECFEQEKEILLVTELCTGGDLSIYQKRKPASVDELRHLFRDITMGVAYCHDLNIVHRDLKFENCLLAEGNARKIAKVIDFGLSAIKREAASEMLGRKTSSPKDEENWLEEALGTKYFVAPEVIDKKIKYGAKCDIWSIGIMLYILLTKEHPYAEAAPKLERKVLFDKILTAAYRERPLLNARVDANAKDILKKLLVRESSNRITATAALNEEWFKPTSGHEANLQEATTGAERKVMCRRLASFHEKSNFDKVILALVAHNAKLKDVETMRKAFVALDTEGDGSLTLAELQAGMSACKLEGDQDGRTMFDGIDTNNNGKINYNEFISATLDAQVIASDVALQELFQFFDKDNSQHISLSELSDVVGVEEAKRVLKKHDSSADGLLSLAEFKVIMQHIAAQRRADSEGPSAQR